MTGLVLMVGVSTVVLFALFLVRFVHRAELWEVVLAIHAGRSVHVGVDNLNVVRRFGRICDEVDCLCCVVLFVCSFVCVFDVVVYVARSRCACACAPNTTMQQ